MWADVSLVSVSVLLLILLAVNVAAKSIISLLALLYPREHPRRHELPAELEEVPRCERFAWTAGQVIAVVPEIIPIRLQLTLQYSRDIYIDHEIKKIIRLLREGRPEKLPGYEYSFTDIYYDLAKAILESGRTSRRIKVIRKRNRREHQKIDAERQGVSTRAVRRADRARMRIIRREQKQRYSNRARSNPQDS